jgi:AcrR family transcriptional regulator
MTRKTRQDWAVAGLGLLRAEGEDAVTLERLCAALGRTKGSFYHHFSDIAQLYEAMFEQWRATQTEAVIVASNAASTNPAQRARALHARVMTLDHELELAIRAWALRDERARRAVTEVDAERVAYLTKLRDAAGTPEAAIVAELEYLVFLGAQQRGLAGKSRRGARLAEVFEEAVEAWRARIKRSGAERREAS